MDALDTHWALSASLCQKVPHARFVRARSQHHPSTLPTLGAGYVRRTAAPYRSRRSAATVSVHIANFCNMHDTSSLKPQVRTWYALRCKIKDNCEIAGLCALHRHSLGYSQVRACCHRISFQCILRMRQGLGIVHVSELPPARNRTH